MSETNGVHHPTDEAIDTLYAWMPPQPPAAPALREPAFSLTLRACCGKITMTVSTCTISWAISMLSVQQQYTADSFPLCTSRNPLKISSKRDSLLLHRRLSVFYGLTSHNKKIGSKSLWLERWD
jgi:hypothetical protein